MLIILGKVDPRCPFHRSATNGTVLVVVTASKVLVAVLAEERMVAGPKKNLRLEFETNLATNIWCLQLGSLLFD